MFLINQNTLNFKIAFHKLFLILSLLVGSLAHAAIDGLPSGNSDDYDEPKYQSIYNSTYQIYSSRYQIYSNEDQALKRLEKQKVGLQSEIDKLIVSLNSNYQEQNQLTERITRNSESQVAEYRELRGMLNDIKALEGAQREIATAQEQLNRRLPQLEKNLVSETEQLKRLEELEKNAKEPMDKIQTQIDNNQKQNKELRETNQVLNGQVTATQATLKDLRKKLQETQNPQEKEQIQSQITSKENYLSELQNNINSNNETIKANQTQQQNLKAELDKLSKPYNTAHEAAEAQRKSKDQADKRLSAVKETIKTNEQAYAVNAGNLKKLNQSYNLRNRQYEALQQNGRDMEARLQLIKSYAERDERSKVARIQELNNLNTDIANQSQRVESARAILAQAEAQLNIDDNRLKEVQRNLSQAEAIMKDQVAGPEGRADGENEGNALALSEAQKNGKIDGTRRGLTAAYDSGYSTGLNEGHTQGTDQTAYKKGYSSGSTVGKNRADTDARPQEQLGYNERELEYLDETKLNKVTLGPVPAQISGTSQSYNQGPLLTDKVLRLKMSQVSLSAVAGKNIDISDKGDEFYSRLVFSTLTQMQAKRPEQQETEDNGLAAKLSKSYYNPRPKQYPHPKIVEFYNKYYNKAFSSEKESSYNSSYPGFYSKVEQGFFDQYKNDPTKTQEGYKVGLAVGSEEKGFKDGDEQTYAANIDSFKQQYKDAGRNRASQYYDNNAVLQFESAQIVELDNDGIYRPGDSVAIQVKVKNFGKKSKANLKAQLNDVSGLRILKLEQNSAALSELPARSEITLTGVLMTEVQGQTQSGSNLKTAFQISESNGSALYSNQQSTTVQYPTRLAIQNYDGVFVPGESKNITLQVQNISRKNQVLDLSLSFDSAKLNLTTEPLNAVQVPAQSTKIIQMTVKGNPSAEFESTEVNFQTQHAGAYISTRDVLSIEPSEVLKRRN